MTKTSHRRAVLVCACAVLTAVVCAGLLIAAAAAHAPPLVLPLVAIVCIGCPMLVAMDLPPALAALRRRRLPRHSRRRALAELRRTLAELPETQHPLGH